MVHVTTESWCTNTNWLKILKNMSTQTLNTVSLLKQKHLHHQSDANVSEFQGSQLVVLRKIYLGSLKHLNIFFNTRTYI